MHSPRSNRNAADFRRAVSELDVYKHERLAYTEFPSRPVAPPLLKRIWTRLKSIRRGIFRLRAPAAQPDSE